MCEVANCSSSAFRHIVPGFPSSSGCSNIEDGPDTGRPLKCHIPGCSASFKKPCRLTWHLRTHDEERPYCCQVPSCRKSYTRPYHLTRHERKAHGPKQSKPGQFRCSHAHCGKFLSSSQLLSRHETNYHKNRQFSCPICYKRFRKHQHLTAHAFEHSSVMPFVCSAEGCAKGFLAKLKLVRHMKTHAGYKCPEEECDLMFSKWSLLRKHKAASHRKLYTCSECHKHFPRKQLLLAHEETHKETRECFECEKCKSVLSTEKTWKAHVNKCLLKKPKWGCGFPACAREFSRKGDLAKHSVLHEVGGSKAAFLVPSLLRKTESCAEASVYLQVI